MRIIVNGQQAFGKSVLEALVDRGEDVVGVFCEPDKEGRPDDPIKAYAVEKGDLPVFQPRSFRKPETHEQIASLEARSLCVMAFVTMFVPEEALYIPTHGSRSSTTLPCYPGTGAGARSTGPSSGARSAPGSPSSGLTTASTKAPS